MSEVGFSIHWTAAQGNVLALILGDILIGRCRRLIEKAGYGWTDGDSSDNSDGNATLELYHRDENHKPFGAYLSCAEEVDALLRGSPRVPVVVPKPGEESEKQ